MGHLVVDSIGLGGGEPMRKSTGPSIKARVCALAVYGPAAGAAGLESTWSAIVRIPSFRVAPLSQCPFRCGMDAGVGVVFVEIEQSDNQGSRSAGDGHRRRCLGTGSTLAGSRFRDRRGSRHPMGGACGRREAGSGDPRTSSRLGGGALTRPSATLSPAPRGEGMNPGRSSAAAISFGSAAQRAEPVHDEAAQPGVGAVPQERPDLAGVTQPDQGHRGPRLPLGQLVLDSSLTTGRCQTEAVTGGPSGTSGLSTDRTPAGSPGRPARGSCASWAAGSRPWTGTARTATSLVQTAA